MTCPGRIDAATLAVAATMNETSGSRVLPSGVGTQMAMPSGSSSRARSVVAPILPAFTSFASRSVGMSCTCERPALTPSTTRALTSKPTTR